MAPRCYALVAQYKQNQKKNKNSIAVSEISTKERRVRVTRPDYRIPTSDSVPFGFLKTGLLAEFGFTVVFPEIATLLTF